MNKNNYMKRIVGIIANTLGFDTNNPFDDKYFVQNQYIVAVKKYGGIPIVIPAVNLNINFDALELCDSFIITGGKRYHKYHYDVIDYAIKTGKKLFGICMGMQIIGMYSNNDYEEKTLKYIDNHYYDQITHKHKKLIIHDVFVKKDSLAYKLFGDKISVNSIHRQALINVSKPFKVVGVSEDNIIEIIEYKNIIGVQFHPELLSNTKKLFEWLIK